MEIGQPHRVYTPRKSCDLADKFTKNPIITEQINDITRTDPPHGNAGPGPLALTGRQIRPSMDIGVRIPDFEPYIYLYSKPHQKNYCCGEEFIDHQGWKKHMNSRHRAISPRYSCSRCGREFSNINGASSHYVHCTHFAQQESISGGTAETSLSNTDLPFKCQWCESSYSTKTGLGVHSRRTHPNEFEESKVVNRKKSQWTD